MKYKRGDNFLRVSFEIPHVPETPSTLQKGQLQKIQNAFPDAANIRVNECTILEQPSHLKVFERPNRYIYNPIHIDLTKEGEE